MLFFLQINPKNVWILTYCGIPLSKQVFQEYDQQPDENKPIQVSEAYTTKDSAYNYTLVRVTTKVRDTNVQLFMDQMKEKYNIKEQYITGYETVDGVAEMSDASTSSDKKIILLPAFKTILQHHHEKHPNLLEPFINRGVPRARGVFQALTAKYPQIKEFILSLSSSGGLGGSNANDEPKKRFRTDDGTSGSAMVVEEAVAHPVLAEIEGLKEELEKTKEALVAKDNTIAAKDLEIATLRAHVAGACTEMVQLAQESSEKVIQIAHFNEHLVHEVQQLEDEINVKTERAEELDNKRLDAIDKLEKDNEKLKDKVHDLEIQVDELPR